VLTRLKYFGHSIGLHLVGQHLNHEAVHNPQLDHSEGAGALAVPWRARSRLGSRSARNSSPGMGCVLGLLLFTRWTCSVAEVQSVYCQRSASGASWPRRLWSPARTVVGNPVRITGNRTQKASQNHSVIGHARFPHPTRTKIKRLSLLWLRAESSQKPAGGSASVPPVQKQTGKYFG